MKLTNCSIRQFAGLALLLALAGCQTAPVRIELQRVNVPVPVPCDEPAPERPAMPTEQLRPGATVDQFVQAAQAEIERREGYEVRLLAALTVCTDPLATR